jgi:5-formyltetrahydrofolate cyclo-ligase
MISEEKQLLRARIVETIRGMSDHERVEKSAAIGAHLAGVRGVIFGFAPLRLEPDWTAAVGKDWDVALPRIEGEELRFHRVKNFAGLAKGKFGTREPLESGVVSVSAAETILVPGVAFDRGGARLGRGGGFYDRLLGDATLTARRIAVCFTCQLVERVPVEPHDVEVDAIVTEDGWIEVRSSGRGRD